MTDHEVPIIWMSKSVSVQLEVDRQHERGSRNDHRDERQGEDELAAGELAEREPVAGWDAARSVIPLATSE